MPIDYPFSAVCPAVPNQILAATISLEEWCLVKVTGQDAKSYLQGQLTCNMNDLSEGEIVYCAHCDPKGKVWANLILFLWQGSYHYLIKNEMSTLQINELKKYAIFAKVVIEALTPAPYLLGFIGREITSQLAAHFSVIPTAKQPIVAQPNGDLLLYLSIGERYLLITNTLPTLPEHFSYFNSQQWILCDLLAGWSVLTSSTTGQFLPQALNIDALHGISFNKGCYVGQEMITRATFRGANKRAMFLLMGRAESMPNVGEQVYLALNENNWKQTGTILQSIKTIDNHLWIQVILNKETPQDSAFKVTVTDNHCLTLHPVNYSMTE